MTISHRAILQVVSFPSLMYYSHFAAFELSERIFSGVRGLRDEHFHGMEPITTHTNHNHEELLENVDVYRFLG